MVHCLVCGTEGFEETDGLYFCLECGTQSQDIRSEELEVGEVGEGTVRTAQSAREIHTAKEARQTAAQLRAALLEKGKDVSIFDIFQTILQMQCDALIRLGFSTVVKDAVKLLWFQYLRYSGYCFAGTQSAAEYTAGMATRRRQRRKGKRTEARKRRLEEPVSSQGQRLAVPPAKRRKVDSATSPSGNYDQFPNDEHLFEDNDEAQVEEIEDGRGLAEMMGEDLYLYDLENCDSTLTVPLLNVKLTVGLCYLGLLYAKQNVLPTDLIEWAATNKLPFYNLPTLLPRHLTSSNTRLTRRLIPAPLTANFLVNAVGALYKSMPLPPVPAPSAKWICHALVDKLKLHALFHRMVDRFLDHVYCCQSPFLLSVVHKVPSGAERVDLECMAVIVFLMRLVHHLDDVFEIEQSENNGSAGDQMEDTPLCTYAWTDWVLFYFRHLKHSIRNPVHQYHFKWMTVLDDYLKFSQEVFETTRTPPIPGSKYSHHCWVYEPLKLRRQVSELFRTTVALPAGAGPEQTDTHATFTPKLVPVDFSRPFLHQLLSANTYPGVSLNQLPHSLKLLLQIGADLLDVAMRDLYEAVVTVERRVVFWQFKEGHQHTKTTIMDSFEMSTQLSRTLLDQTILADDDSEPHPPCNSLFEN